MHKSRRHQMAVRVKTGGPAGIREGFYRSWALRSYKSRAKCAAFKINTGMSYDSHSCAIMIRTYTDHDQYRMFFLSKALSWDWSWSFDRRFAILSTKKLLGRMGEFT